jgi:hypothetical protein
VLRRCDPDSRILRAVDAETKAGTLVKRELTEYLAGRDASTYVIAYAVRNAFFHGDLTPNIAGADPANVVAVLRVLGAALKGMIDRELGGRMRAFRANLPPPAPVPDGAPF